MTKGYPISPILSVYHGGAFLYNDTVHIRAKSWGSRGGIVFVLLAFLLVLSGCLFGNGEGYNRGGNPKADSAPSDDTTSPGSPAGQAAPIRPVPFSSDPGVYYSIVPGFKCAGPDGDHEEFFSSLEFDGTDYEFSTSDRCGVRTPVLVPPAELTFSKVFGFIVRAGTIYERLEGVPYVELIPVSYTETWCYDSSFETEVAVLRRFGSNPLIVSQAVDLTVSFKSGAKQVSLFASSSSSVPGERLYTSGLYSVQINKSATDSSYQGSFTDYGTGSSQTLQCYSRQ